MQSYEEQAKNLEAQLANGNNEVERLRREAQEKEEAVKKLQDQVAEKEKELDNAQNPPE